MRLKGTRVEVLGGQQILSYLALTSHLMATRRGETIDWYSSYTRRRTLERFQKVPSMSSPLNPITCIPWRLLKNSTPFSTRRTVLSKPRRPWKSPASCTTFCLGRLSPLPRSSLLPS